MTEQVNVAVSYDQKQRWEDYAEETLEYSTTSDLVRTAVEKEIRGVQDNDDETVVMENEALSTDVQDIQDQVSQIRQDISWLRQQEQTHQDLSGLANEVLEEIEILPAELGEEMHGALTIIEASGPQTVTALAERTGLHPNEVQDAIEYLREDLQHTITSRTIDNQVHWFLEE